MKTIWYFVKFCEKEEYADDFMKGSLYLNRLSYYKAMEDSDDGRADKYEAAAAWLQPPDVNIKLSIDGLNRAIEILPEDLAAPVYWSHNHHDHLHVLCLYAIYTNGFECVDGQVNYSDEKAPELKRQLEVHQDNFKFGQHAVIVPATLFINRVKGAIKNLGYSGRMKLADYYNPDLSHTEFTENIIPFKKQQRFSYQNEFRIVVNNKTIGDTPLRIEVGDLSDISAKINATSLNSLLKLDSIEKYRSLKF